MRIAQRLLSVLSTLVFVGGFGACTPAADDGDTDGNTDTTGDCFIDSDCPSTAPKCEGGVCKVVTTTTCTSNNQCTGGKVCTGGQCVTPTDTCALAETDVGSCVRAAVTLTLTNKECTQDAECKGTDATAPDICDAGLCKVPCAAAPNNTDAYCRAQLEDSATDANSTCTDGKCVDSDAAWNSTCGTAGSGTAGTLIGDVDGEVADGEQLNNAQYVASVSGTSTLAGSFGTCTDIAFAEDVLVFEDTYGGQPVMYIYSYYQAALEGPDAAPTGVVFRELYLVTLKSAWVAGEPIVLPTSGVGIMQDLHADVDGTGHVVAGSFVSTMTAAISAGSMTVGDAGN